MVVRFPGHAGSDVWVQECSRWKTPRVQHVTSRVPGNPTQASPVVVPTTLPPENSKLPRVAAGELVITNRCSKTKHRLETDDSDAS